MDGKEFSKETDILKKKKKNSYEFQKSGRSIVQTIT